MDQHIDVQTAATELDRVLDSVAQHGGPVFIDRPGKPSVVLLSLGTFLEIKKPPQWLQDGWDRAKEAGLDTMTMDEIDAEIADARRDAEARTAGR